MGHTVYDHGGGEVQLSLASLCHFLAVFATRDYAATCIGQQHVIYLDFHSHQLVQA
jgi:hypothetical protein